MKIIKTQPPFLAVLLTATALCAGARSACAQDPEISTDRAEYLPGEKIVVRFRNTPGGAKDWITLNVAGMFSDKIYPGKPAASGTGKTGYDLKSVTTTDSPPPDMPIRYRWNVTEKRLYALPPRSKVQRVFDPQAPGWANNYFRLRKLYGDLIYLYLSFWQPDEAAILRGQLTWQMSGWVDYYLLTGDIRVRDAIRRWADLQYRVWSSDREHFKAGYWKKQDVDHGNEDTGYTVGRWWLLQPGDAKLTFLVESTARLAGNWGPPDVPQWYDWQKHRWKAYFMGSEFMGEATYDTGSDYRLANIALLAYAATGNERYLKLARDYLDGYVERLDQLGEEPDQKRYLEGWVFNHEDPRLGRYFNGVRYHFMESMANPLMDLFRMTGDRQYLAATRKILEPTVPDSFYTWVGNKESSILANYRFLSGDRFMDRAVMEWVEETRDFPDDLFAYFWRPLGDANTRWDWMHMHWIRTHPAPTTYRLAYQITGDERYLNWMLEGACERAQLLYAQQSRPETRHGPDRGTNDWDWRLYALAWEIVDVLFPMAGRQFAPGGEGSDAVSLYDVRFFRDNGGVGIPETIAINYRATTPDRRVIDLYNAADESQTLRVEPQDFRYKKVTAARVKGGKIERQEKSIRVTLPSHARVTVEMDLVP